MSLPEKSSCRTVRRGAPRAGAPDDELYTGAGQGEGTADRIRLRLAFDIPVGDGSPLVPIRGGVDNRQHRHGPRVAEDHGSCRCRSSPPPDSPDRKMPGTLRRPGPFFPLPTGRPITNRSGDRGNMEPEHHGHHRGNDCGCDRGCGPSRHVGNVRPRVLSGAPIHRMEQDSVHEATRPPLRSEWYWANRSNHGLLGG